MFEASADEVDRMVRAGHAAQPAGTRSAARRARSCSTAPPTCSRSIARSSSRCASARPARPWSTRCSKCARRSISCASMRPRRGASSPGRCRCPGPTGEQNELRLHGRGVFACISPWNFPLAIFTGLVVGAAGRGQCRHRQAGRANAADRRAGDRADARGGHPQGHRPARARRGQGRRRNADRASAARGRRLHRLDRDRAHDQPHPGRARRADHPVHRRNRRPECDDRRFSSALPEQVTRDVISSAFQSAGQRCSALRVLFVQDDVADPMLAMIAGAMEALTVGDPANSRPTSAR